MRKFLLMLSVLMYGSATLSADWCDAFAPSYCCVDNDWPSPINIQINGGFRRDKFRWSIAGLEVEEDFFVPSTLSELQWKDLRIAQVGGSASYVSCTNYAIKVEGDYGHIYHGRNIDSDYDDFGNLLLQSNSDAGKGFVYDIESAVGYRVTSTGGRFIATPWIGYSYHGQELHIFDGDLVFNNFPPPFNGTGPIEGLNNKYTTRWFGPWIGLDFSTRVEKCAYIFGGFEWHLVSYRATGIWNLREDEFGPFRHRAHGHGYIVKLGGNWEIWKNWSIGIQAHYRNFRTHHGRERVTVYVDQEGFPVEPFTVQTRFNQAKWSSVDVEATIAWRF